MFKRPVIRSRQRHEYPQKYKKPEPGTFLYDIVNPKPPRFYKHERAPVYQKEVYLALLKKNCENLGIPYTEPDIPNAEVNTYTVSKKDVPLNSLDKIYMKIRYMKNGTVKIKIITAFADMYNKYYSQGKKPPIKTLINAYKLMGFPSEFTEEIQKKHMKNLKMSSIIFKKVEALLTKEPVKKTKSKKSKTVEKEPLPDVTDDQDDILNEDDNDNENEDDNQEEDGGMDMEIENDDDEICEDQEEYYSDGGE